MLIHVLGDGKFAFLIINAITNKEAFIRYPYSQTIQDLGYRGCLLGGDITSLVQHRVKRSFGFETPL